MDLYFSHFSVLLRTTLNYFTTKIIFCRLPKGFLPQKTLEQGDLSLLKFSPEETFVQKRPLGQEQFCPRKCLYTIAIVQIDIFTRRGHPAWQEYMYVVWAEY